MGSLVEVLKQKDLCKHFLEAFELGGWTAEMLGRITPSIAEEMRRSVHIPFFPEEMHGLRDVAKQLARWRKLYSDKFGIKLKGEISIPERVRGYDRLVVVATTDLEEISRCFSAFLNLETWREDLLFSGRAEINSARTCENGPYAVWVKNGLEPDQASTFQVPDKSHFITLPEWLSLVMMHYLETGSFIDRDRATICLGSWIRFSEESDQSIPTGCHQATGDVFEVGFCSPDLEDRWSGIRTVVA